MPKLNGKPSARKAPEKPNADFPMFAHANGSWAKKVRGRLVYFGAWDDPDAALQKWNEQKDDLLAGRTPRIKDDELTVRDLLNHFLTAKERKLKSNEISARTFAEYQTTCKRVSDEFGLRRSVIDIRATDFESFRAKLANGRGPYTISNEVRKTRMIFKYAHESGLIEQPVRFGPEFKESSQKVFRQARAKKGERLFEAAQIRAMLKSAKQPLRAMILLGVNCGFGNTDVAMLPRSAVDLDHGWIRFPRPKTSVKRRCPLWKETVMVLREAFEMRREPAKPEFSELVFLTRLGQPWVRYELVPDPKNPKQMKGKADDAIAKAMAKVLAATNLRRAGLGFYALRHVFETIGGETADQVAVNFIMGHVDRSDDMSAKYRERISDERLQRVTDFVHNWLFAKPAPPKRKTKVTASG
jgi:integrase